MPAACCPEVETPGSWYCYCNMGLTDSSETSVVACRTARYHPRRPQSKTSKLISIDIWKVQIKFPNRLIAFRISPYIVSKVIILAIWVCVPYRTLFGIFFPVLGTILESEINNFLNWSFRTLNRDQNDNRGKLRENMSVRQQNGWNARIFQHERWTRCICQRCSVRCGWCHLLQPTCSILRLYRRHVSQPAPWCRECVDPSLRTWTRIWGGPMKR